MGTYAQPGDLHTQKMMIVVLTIVVLHTENDGNYAVCLDLVGVTMQRSGE